VNLKLCRKRTSKITLILCKIKSNIVSQSSRTLGGNLNDDIYTLYMMIVIAVESLVQEVLYSIGS
jgi:hypothetical protein